MGTGNGKTLLVETKNNTNVGPRYETLVCWVLINDYFLKC